MQRYFVDNLKYINKDDSFHITKVMRKVIGDEIIVCFEGRCFLSKIISLNANVNFEIIKELEKPNNYNVSLLQGIPKNPKAEIVVKYATMYNAKEIFFVEMDRSEAKYSFLENKVTRYEKIAKEASELAHRFETPHIKVLKKLEDVDLSKYEYIFIADEDYMGSRVVDHIKDIEKEANILVVIGPEGGISDCERNYLKHQKGLFITLGTNILATEIASLAFLSHFL